MWRVAVFFLPVLVTLYPAGSAAAVSRPDCAGAVEVADASVIGVDRNGVLALSDGRAVVLEDIRLPLSGPGPAAGQALAALRDMTASKPLVLTATPPAQDRYGRIRAQAFAGGVWLQEALLEKGLARVAISPDRQECASELLAAESHARGHHAGIWAGGPASPYRVRSPRELQDTAGTFQIVEGRVANVGRAGSGRVFIDFGDDWQDGFSATIAPQDWRRFRDFDLDGLVARRIRVRGLVQDYRGRPEIALANPAQIEILN
jgi:endonuclease YncB( thermonuclease family)